MEFFGKTEPSLTQNAKAGGRCRARTLHNVGCGLGRVDGCLVQSLVAEPGTWNLISDSGLSLCCLTIDSHLLGHSLGA